MAIDLFGLAPHKCYLCGHRFEARDEYVYKVLVGSKITRWFCSYSCFREYEKNHEKPPQYTPPEIERQVAELLENGKTTEEIADRIGVSVPTVDKYRKRWAKQKAPGGKQDERN